jgi:hypothetical protein
MKRVLNGVGWALAILLSGWMVTVGVAQSTRTAPEMREVNSDGIYTLLNSIDGLIDAIESALALDATHGNDVSLYPSGPMGTREAKDFDGSTLPNVVTEGQAVRNAGTLSGGLFAFLTNEAGTKELGQLEDDPEVAASYSLPILSVRRNAAASSAGTTGDYATTNTDALGLLWSRFLDPCSGVAKTYYVLNASSAATVEIANSVASEFFYICSVNLVAAAAQTIAIAEDDTDGCGSLTAGLHGGATAATGWSFAANGGIALGNGSSTVMKTSTAARYLCFITGQAAQISGTIAYVSAP